MKPTTLKSYLLQQGVKSTTPSDIIAGHKKTFRKKYQQKYQAKRNMMQKRIEMRLSKAEYDFFLLKNKQYNRRYLGRFIKESALAYLQKEYVVVSPTTLATLIEQVKIIGNNINQCIHAMNALKAHHEASRYKALKKSVEVLVDLVQEAFKYPPELTGKRLSELIDQYLAANPKDRDGIIRYVSDGTTSKTRESSEASGEI